MQTGDLVLFRGTGFISWIVRRWTRSAFSHVGVLWIVDGMPLVLEATFTGVTCHALANRAIDGPNVFPTGRALNLTSALIHLGDCYSYKDAIRAGMNENPVCSGWDCAEYAADILGLDSHAKGWTPQRLAETILLEQ